MSTYWITVLISLIVFIIGFVFLHSCVEYGETQPIKLKRKYWILLLISDFIYRFNIAASVAVIVTIITCLFTGYIIFLPKPKFIKKCVD